MSILTWRDVSQPDFGGSLLAYRGANEAMNNGFESLNRALDTYKNSRADAADRNIINRELTYQDPAAYSAALKDHTVVGADGKYAHVNTLEAVANHVTNLLNNAQTQANVSDLQMKHTQEADAYAREAAARTAANEYQRIAGTGDQVGANTYLAAHPEIGNMNIDRVNFLLTNGVATGQGNTNLIEGQAAIKRNNEATKLAAQVAGFTDERQIQALVDDPNLDPMVRPYLVNQLRQSGHVVDAPIQSGYSGATSTGTPVGPIVSTGAGIPGMPAVGGMGYTPAGYGSPTAGVTANRGPSAILAGVVGPSAPTSNIAGAPVDSVGTGMSGGGGVDSAYDVTYQPNDTAVASKMPAFKPTQTTGGDFVKNVGPQMQRATAGTLPNTSDGTSAAGKYQIVSSTWAKVAPKIWSDWESRPMTASDQDAVGKYIFDHEVKGDPAKLAGQWPSVTRASATATPAQVAAMPWEQAKEYIASGESRVGGAGGNNLTSVFDRRDHQVMDTVRANLNAQQSVARAYSNPIVKNFLATADSTMDPQTAAEWGKANLPQLKNVPLSNIIQGIKESNAVVSGDLKGTPNSAQSLLAWVDGFKPVGTHWWNKAGREISRAVSDVTPSTSGFTMTNLNGNMIDPSEVVANLKQWNSPATANAAVAAVGAENSTRDIANAAKDVDEAKASLIQAVSGAAFEPQKWTPVLEQRRALYTQKQAILDALQKRGMPTSNNDAPAPIEPVASHKASAVLQAAAHPNAPLVTMGAMGPNVNLEGIGLKWGTDPGSGIPTPIIYRKGKESKTSSASSKKSQVDLITRLLADPGMYQ